MSKPDILQVIGEVVALRKAGKEYVGLCPLHTEKSPSFWINPDKGVFFCHGCHEGGDVFTFAMKYHNATFTEAKKILGVDGERPTPDPVRTRRRDEAKRIAEWARKLSNEIRDRLRDTGESQRRARMAKKYAAADRTFLAGELSRLEREWSLLCDLDDDLNSPQHVVELWREREVVEALAGGM